MEEKNITENEDSFQNDAREITEQAKEIIYGDINSEEDKNKKKYDSEKRKNSINTDKKKVSKKDFKNNLYSVLTLIVIIIGVVIIITQFVLPSISSKSSSNTADLSNATDKTALSEGDGNTINNDSNIEEVENPDAILTSEYPAPDHDIDWDSLLAENSDVYAWVYIPNTDIDYPVLSSTGDEDMDYYLTHNLDKEYEKYPGCIYSQNTYNTTDFTDFNQIIYGHNMKDGSMFASLHDFEDKSFFDDNEFIYIYTPDETYTYGIFAAYKTDDYLIPDAFDMTDEYVQAQYIDYIFGDYNNSMTSYYREEFKPTNEDQMITLSTCVSGESTHRYLVQGKLLESDNTQ